MWANIPFLQKIQFPFRWLSIATLFGSLTFVLAISQIPWQNIFLHNLKKYSLIVFFVGLFLFNTSQIVLPSETLSREVFAGTLDGLLEKESYDCWWTIWSKSEAFAVKEKVTASARQITISEWKAELREFAVEKGLATHARIATFYYPHWQASINGKQVKIESAADGAILIPLPAEKSQVSLTFAEPAFLKISQILSLLSWAFWLLIGFGYLIKRLFFSPSLNRES